MKITRILMGMPICVEVVDDGVRQEDLDKIFVYFKKIDQKFSTYKKNSEISLINRHKIKKADWSKDMKLIFQLAEKTKQQTDGYFDIFHYNKFDPSGVVKGWAILQAAKILEKASFKNFFINAGGDIQVCGQNKNGQLWKVGIKNPFDSLEIVKAVTLKNQGIATSGNYIRGNHIYNPKSDQLISDVVSLTVIGPNVLEADRFATAAFAMGKKGIQFIQGLNGFEGYMIDNKGLATYTSGFESYT